MSKLVRDLIPEVIPEDKRDLFRFSTLNEKEYREHLNKKLLEEVNEFLEVENMEELADIFEVIDAIMKLNQFDREELRAVQESKREKRGGFEKRLLMESANS
jgi:predicted house-cleaning noncanonical NTP pyrophosphatase (MazG superfamily)